MLSYLYHVYSFALYLTIQLVVPVPLDRLKQNFQVAELMGKSLRTVLVLTGQLEPLHQLEKLNQDHSVAEVGVGGRGEDFLLGVLFELLEGLFELGEVF